MKLPREKGFACYRIVSTRTSLGALGREIDHCLQVCIKIVHVATLQKLRRIYFFWFSVRFCSIVLYYMDL